MRRHSSKPPHWVAALVGVLALLALGRPISAQPPVPIISPTDVTTPTPGPLHFPTPTPAMPPDGAAPDATAPADLAGATLGSIRSRQFGSDHQLLQRPVPYQRVDLVHGFCLEHCVRIELTMETANTLA